MTTKATEKKALNMRLRELRQDRKAWLTGANAHWGQPWCNGGETCHKPSFCEGCATVAEHREHAGRIAEQIAELKSPTLTVRIPVPVQGALF